MLPNFSPSIQSIVNEVMSQVIIRNRHINFSLFKICLNIVGFMVDSFVTGFTFSFRGAAKYRKE